MLFISTGIFDDKLHPQILLVGTTANSPLRILFIKKKEKKKEDIYLEFNNGLPIDQGIRM